MTTTVVAIPLSHKLSVFSLTNKEHPKRLRKNCRLPPLAAANPSLIHFSLSFDGFIGPQGNRHYQKAFYRRWTLATDAN